MADERINLSEFSQRLEALKQEALGIAELAKQAARPVELDQNKVGRLSRMDAMQGQAMAHANAQRQSERLMHIERALGEIQAGEYGRCAECDEFIATARLIANPVTQTCIACATMLEGE